MSPHRTYRFDDFLVDPESWRLTRSGREIHLEPIVLKLLIYLIANRDRLVTRQELMDTVWGDTVISDSALSKAVARLRSALRDDSAHPRYLETVHSQGYRFIAEVEEGEGTVSTHPTAKTRWVSTVVVIIVALLAALWMRSPWDDSGPGDIQSLAVLPLSNLTGDPAQDYYADGLQDILITELSQIDGLRVTSRQSTRRYRDSQQSATEIAGELGVDVLVEGSLLRLGEHIEIAIQVIHGQSDEHLWAEHYSRDTPHVFELFADVARAIGAELNPTLASPDRERLTVDPRAIVAYSLGLMYLDRWGAAEVQLAVEHLQRAVEIEPDFALGWSQLAVAYVVQSVYGFTPPREAVENARVAALNAIRADERFYGGHAALGWVQLYTGEFDSGCEAFQVALRLNPSAPHAIHGSADCLMIDGHWDESIERMREFAALGPFTGMHARGLAYHLFLARRYDEAIAEVIAARARVPGLFMHYIFAWVYWAQGDYDKALEAEAAELKRRGEILALAALEEGLAADGPSGALHAMAEALIEKSAEAWVDPFEIAKTFTRAGSLDEAFHWLNKAVDYGSYETYYIAFRPDFDVLRDDPRYEELAERVYGQ